MATEKGMLYRGMDADLEVSAILAAETTRQFRPCESYRPAGLNIAMWSQQPPMALRDCGARSRSSV